MKLKKYIISGLMILTLLYAFISAEEKSSGYMIALLVTMIAVFVMIRIEEAKKAEQVIFFALAPLLTFLIVENYTHYLTEMRLGPALLNILVYYLFFLTLFFVTGRAFIAYPLCIALFGLAGLANYFVIEFRSSPILPWDLYSIKVAGSVAGDFEYTLSRNCCIVVILLILLAGRCLLIQFKFENRKRYFLAIITAFTILIWGKAIQTDSVVEAASIDTTLFTPKVLYRNNGLVLGFVYNMQFLNIDKPEGYDANKLAELYEGNESETPQEGIKPNIIVVMNEAFSDLRILGEYETNLEVMPFIDALTENTQKGVMYASVKGGNTANTEFEFLTGQTLQFLPIGSVAYQQYIRSESPSIASQLKTEGYKTIAMHPYNSTGWNRNTVYDLFGFDEKYFVAKFGGASRVRNYISDEATYEKIISLYESKEKDEKLFVFDVTMQNHGGYTKPLENFDPDVKVLDKSGKYLYATERYLSLMKISDQAFENLVRYFSAQEEPTIILMFGDHQPADYVLEAISDIDETDLKESQKRYAVPYVMWANYEIDEISDDETSANYLALRILNETGIKLTGFQEYLEELEADYPVVTGNMAINSEGVYFERDDEVLKNDLNLYAQLEYNYLADIKNRLKNFFSY